MTAEIVLVRVSGQDRPGAVAALWDALAEQDLKVLDVGSSSIHSMFAFGMLLHVPRSDEQALAHLATRGRELGLTVEFEAVSAEAYNDWVGQQGKPRYIVTLLGREISAGSMAAVTGAIARHGLNIDDTMRLSGRQPLDDSAPLPYTVIELSVRGTPRDADGLRRAFLELAQQHMLDIAFQRDDIFRRNRRLVAFDMDSTLIKVEVINELAAAAGVGEQVAAITEAAMRGELDFDASFRKRLSLLKGLDESVLQEIADRLPLTEGAERLFKTLRYLGFKTAIISGGFQYFGRHLQKMLAVDYVLANELEVVDGKVTGEVAGDIVNGERKAHFLREIAAREGIRLEQVIAVGDGANDLPMLRLAGMGIAFRAKPVVRESASHALSVSGLDGILYLIGVRDRETMAMLEEATPGI
jgi:phosphoserine phosphatase